MINTNLCTAVAMMVWVAWDYIYRDKPSMIGAVNGMITGLVGITQSRRVRQRLGCDHHRNRRRQLHHRVDGDPLPQSNAPTFRECRRYPGGDLHPRYRRALWGSDGVGLLADPAVVEYIGVHGAS